MKSIKSKVEHEALSSISCSPRASPAASGLCLKPHPKENIWGEMFKSKMPL